MPEIGEIRRATDVGKVGYVKYIWSICIGCGEERWVRCQHISTSKKHSRMCRSCFGGQYRGEAHPRWKGGRYKAYGGYTAVLLRPTDFFYPMTMKDGYVLEHRLVVAKAIGRCLHRWEIVHHKKGFAKDDNRYPETLQLVTDDRHKQITILESRIAKLEDKVEKQSSLIKLLQWQIKELNKSGILENKPI